MFVCGRVKFQDWRVKLSTYAGGPKSCKWSGSWIMASSNSRARSSTSRRPTTNPCGCPAPAEISHKNFKSGSWILKAWGCEGKKLKLVCHLVQIKPQLLFFSLLITLTALEPSPGRSHQRELLRSERGLAIHEEKGCDMPVGWNDRRRLWLLPQWL